MLVGERLRSWRKKNGLTQEEVAEGICSISYYSKIENNKAEPSEEIIILVAEKLNISIVELMEEKDLNYAYVETAQNIYRLLKENKYQDARNEYYSLMEDYEATANPSFKLMIKLIELRLEMVNSKSSYIHDKYQEVVSFSDYITASLKTLYNRVCGLYHYLYGDIDDALHLYTALNEVHNYEYRGDVLYNLSLIYLRKNHIHKSIKHLKSALEIYAREMDYGQCTNCYLLLGISYAKMEEYETAITYYDKVILATEDHEVTRKVYHNLGVAYEKLNRIESAINYYLKSLELKNNENEIKVLNTTYALAEMYYKTDEYQLALSYVKQGLHVATEYKLKEHQLKFGVLQKQLGDEELTEYLQSIVIPFFRERKDFEVVIKYLSLLGEQYAKNHQYKQAYQQYKKLSELKGVEL